MDQLLQANRDMAARVEQMAVESRREKSNALVSEWVASGKLPPALRVQAFALGDALSAAPAEVEVLADEAGATRKVSTIDLLAEIIAGLAPAEIVPKQHGRTWTGSADTDHETPTAMTPDELRAMAALAGEK
jgi:hypothetical protein